ncbi:hypothetical protein [Paraburkholderia sp. PGU19]|uniref:hypothetical protein n=1 Tax=Paraburkholderia sp. PGU19 TaxID=2735434 RepID=UPI001FB07332|nr:hypothetical protein [Paraburkholderia sp. PGU19]
MNNDSVPEQQREVQRLLGRCLLRLQQYERLMKAILADHRFTGEVYELDQARAQLVDTKDSLGVLVNKLFGSFVVADEAHKPASDRKNVAPSTSVFGYRVSLQMSATDHAQAYEDLKDLVELRNGLVHHFIDHFNLMSVDGCTAAQINLSECYVRIDRHFEQLRQWAHQMEKAKASIVDLLEDFLIDGRRPDGTIEWGCLELFTRCAKPPPNWRSMVGQDSLMRRRSLSKGILIRRRTSMAVGRGNRCSTNRGYLNCSTVRTAVLPAPRGSGSESFMFDVDL